MAKKASNAASEDLHRGLEERHIQLIAIGGAIGVGLFLGSSTAIKTAGPALMLSYLIGGVIIYLMMRSLGEIAVEHPVSGSFAAYAHIFMGPRAGYITGWTYWFMWVVTGMAEITAVGVYCTFWWPELPQWIPALGALLCMTTINLIAVNLFGEFEFWFAMIKVVVIVAMIAAGIGIIFFGIGHGGVPTGISNIYALEGGFMPNGGSGVILALTMVMFAFLGIELVGVTAGEAANPERTIPGAINKVLWRILIFYIGALFVIMSIFPWMEIGTQGSPFVLTFENLGIGKAAAIINFVVLTAALSSCNSGIFSNGRMLYNLALQKRAPAYFGAVSKNKVPARAIIVSSLIMLIGVVLNYVLPEQVFIIVTSVATFAAVWVWGTVFVVQIKSRKMKTPEQIKNIKYPSLLYPYANYAGLAFMAFIYVVLAINEDTRIAMIVGPIWMALLYAVYHMVGWGKEDAANTANSKNGTTVEDKDAAPAPVVR